MSEIVMSGGTVSQSGNVVVIGVKPNMNYVVACLTLFNAGMSEIRVRARGKHISKAVDTVEMLRRVFLKNVAVEDVILGTENLTDHYGKEVGVSTIDIRLCKPLTSQI